MATPATPEHALIIGHFIEQAEWNRALGSPFTADLCEQFKTDFEAGGPLFDLCKDWTGNPRKDALGLRIAGALHHAVLTGGAPELAAVYPASQPDWSMAEVWPLASDWLAANKPRVTAFIQSPPQTNETRRSIALLPGFLELAARFDMPMHLLELGASAGLNQNWDRFNYSTDSWSYPGDSDVTISTDWSGPPPAHLQAKPVIASRAACDLGPLDVRDDAQMLRLKCYTWADQTERLARLDAAIKLARETKVTVDQGDAEDWLRAKLTARPATGLTVIYHSVFLIYPPRDQIKRIMDLIREAGEAATPANPVAWLCYESEALFDGSHQSPKMHARLQYWPGGEVKTIAISDGHVTKIQAL